MGFDDPLESLNDRRMIDDLAITQGLFAILNSDEELLLIGNIGPQRLVDEPRLAAPGRRGQPLKLTIEIGIDASGNGDGFGHMASLLNTWYTMLTLYTRPAWRANRRGIRERRETRFPAPAKELAPKRLPPPPS